MAVFTDFHVACADETALQDVFHSAIKLGYDWLAVSTFVAELGKKGKKQQQQQNVIRTPEKVELAEQSLQLLKVEGRKFRQFSRLTALLEDASNTHKLSSPEVQAYDLLAVQPTNEATFKLACTTLEVDIITLNMTEKLPFYFKRPLVNLAIERGIHFEILYSPAVRDSSFRQNTISTALQLTSTCKGKNIIVSSGCEKAIELRGPYDVANLGQLFGLSPPQSKDAICKSCRAVIMHAEARKITKSVVGVIKSSELASSDKWVLDCVQIAETTEQHDSESSISKTEKPPKKKRKT